MRRRRGPNKTRGKSPHIEKNEDNEEKEAEDSVEAIVNYKKQIKKEQVYI